MRVRIKRNPAVAWLEACLWIAGCLSIGYCAFIWGRAQFDQAQANWTLEHVLPGAPGTDVSTDIPKGAAEGSLVGRIDIPRLDLSTIVFEGTSDDTLARGVGHLRGSAAPGERGNLVLAGHRDTFFRDLGGIRRSDLRRSRPRHARAPDLERRARPSGRAACLLGVAKREGGAGPPALAGGPARLPQPDRLSLPAVKPPVRAADQWRGSGGTARFPQVASLTASTCRASWRRSRPA